jgi:hypothetical protein
MYFVTEILGWWTNLDFRDRLPSCAGKYAGITSCFLQTRVQFDSSDGPAFDLLAGTAGSYVAKSLV